MDLEWKGGVEGEEEIERVKIVIKIYSMKKDLFSINEKYKLHNGNLINDTDILKKSESSIADVLTSEINHAL